MVYERAWTERPTSIASSSSSDSGTSTDSGGSSVSGIRSAKTLSGDSGVSMSESRCATSESRWFEEEQCNDDAWECASDASGEYEPLRHPLRGTGTSPPEPPPPPPPPRTLPRRKDLTRHLGLPSELSASLAELAGRDVNVRRKELEMYSEMKENRHRGRGILRRWTTTRKRRAKSPDGEAMVESSENQQRNINTSLPDLARLRVDMRISVNSTPSTPTTPSRRRGAPSPRLIRSALRKVQERALKATSRVTRTGEVPWADEGATLISQCKRGSLENSAVVRDSLSVAKPHSWTMESTLHHRFTVATTEPRSRTMSPAVVRKPRLPTPPPEDSAVITQCHTFPATALAPEEESPYMTMEAIRETLATPAPQSSESSGSDPGYLDMDTIRCLIRANSEAMPTAPPVPAMQRSFSEQCGGGSNRRSMAKDVRPVIIEEC